MRHATLTSVFLTAMLSVLGVRADEPDPPSPLLVDSVALVARTPVSERFRRESEAAARTVPRSVWDGIENAGWRLQLAEFVVDAAPSLRGVRPRGWPSGATWDNSDALHLPSAKLLVVAEKRRNRAGEIVPCHRTGGVLRHELGHAFDMVGSGRYRFQSAKPEFVAAYQQDVSRLGKSDREQFSYYLQGSKAGRQEAFAEAFAVVLGGGSSDIDPRHFKRKFPSVIAEVRQSISRFDAAPADPPQARRRSGLFGG